MNIRRLALAALALSAVLALSTTGAFTSTTADRSVDVSVAEDENAYLGLSWSDLDRCGEQELVEVSNRFGTKLTEVDAEVVREEGLRAGISYTPAELDPGESQPLNINIRPENASQVDQRSVTVRIEASGPSTNVAVAQRTRPVTNCPTRSTPTPTETPVGTQTETETESENTETESENTETESESTETASGN